jgi:AraC-like DNA-binding protein
MAATASNFSALRFSTDDLPERERVAAWRELYGRKFLRLEHEPQPDLPFHADVSLRLLPGLGIVSAAVTLLRVGRSRELITDGNDNLTLQISSIAGRASQLGRETEVGAGDAVVLSNADVGTFTFQSTQSASDVLALSLPRSSLGPLLRDPDAALVRVVPKDMEALRLLKWYVGIVEDAPALATAELRQLAVTHVYDLLALALGATRDAKELARGRGLRAARLAAIKADISERVGHSGLSVGQVAAMHGLTPRYVQMLFETEGMTFTEFLLDRRLTRAHRMLSDPHVAERSITSIAFDAGFGDLSYFARSFRRRFGMTPSDVRENARRGASQE